VYQYLPYLEESEIEYVVRPAVPAWLFERLYQSRSAWRQRAYTVIEALFRTAQILTAWQYDVVFLQKAVTGTYLRGLAPLLFMLNGTVIYDFDDAVQYGPPSVLPWPLSSFQDTGQVSWIIRRSAAVIAGNEYLADFARTLNRNVSMIPTSVSMAREEAAQQRDEDLSEKPVIVVGWSGGRGTNAYLNAFAPVLEELYKRDRRFCLKIVSSDLHGIELSRFRNIPVFFEKWSLSREARLISSFDIGIMPLDDDKWSMGKCGLKLLLYMSLGVPVVASPVGVNADMIEDGLNGFLAKTQEQWVEAICRLAVDQHLRTLFVREGFKTVHRSYALEDNVIRFLTVLHDVYTGMLKEVSG